MTTMAQTWGFMQVLPKLLLSDGAFDADAFLAAEFARSLPDGCQMLDQPTFEWVDIDEHPDPFGGFTLEDGTYIPPLENAFVVRGTASITQR